MTSLVYPTKIATQLVLKTTCYFKNDVKEFFKHMFDYNFRRLLRDENC